MAANFAARYKKDLSTEALKAKLVRRKSIQQKESRHQHFNKGRQFGLADVNTQHVRDKELSRLEETGEEHSSEKSKGKPKQAINANDRGKERKEMLQRYKAEKELRKLKEQRQKPVFKCGLYKPEMPFFLPLPSQIPVLSKPKEKVVLPPTRVTRSKAKNILEETAKPCLRPQPSAVMPKCPSKNSAVQPPKQRQQHIFVDKPVKKESKGAQSALIPDTSRRITRTMAAAMSSLPQVSKPAVTAGCPAQKRATNKGKQKVENKSKEVLLEVNEDEPVEPEEERANFQLAPAEEAKAFPEKENVPTSGGSAVSSRRTRSFAPQNFVFKPLEGMASYKVTPMTPSSVNQFLSPHLTWTPIGTTSEVPSEDAKETTPQGGRSESECFLAAEGVKDNLPECQSAWESQEEEKMEGVSEEKTAAVTGEAEVNEQLSDLPTPETSEPTGEPQHDVPYFRNILRSETERLTSRCLEWDGAAEMDIPEDAKDLIRTTVGQTRLLIAQRFRQFEGLVDNCEFRRGEKETTCSDLDGFWDMVAFQVEDVNKKFESLKSLQGNGWQMVDDNQTKQIPKKKTSSQKPPRARSPAAGKAAAQKRLAAIKAMMKNKMKPEGVAGSRDIPEEEEGKITFDGGFFRVESPAKPFPGQTPKSAIRSSRRASQQATPRSTSRAFLQSCADTCITRVSTPAATRDLPPLPVPDTFAGPSRTDLPGHISDQSDPDAIEGSSAALDGRAEETDETQTASPGSASYSSDLMDLVSRDCQEMTESPECKKEASGILEEVQQAAADLGEAVAVSSPEKDALSKGASSEGEEQHTPECQTGRLLSDFCSDRIPEDKAQQTQLMHLGFCSSSDPAALTPQPHLDCSLFFTPPIDKAKKFATAASHSDLIMFSPLPIPAGEK